ncbi:HYR domain-containing protein, partial [Flavobacterium sp. F-380]
DVNGNIATDMVIVTVEDKIAPVVLTKNITVQLNAAGTVSIVAADVNNGSTDACGIATLTLDK